MRKQANIPTILSVSREARREVKVEALRDGRKQRAVVFEDRRKQASKRACRGNFAQY